MVCWPQKNSKNRDFRIAVLDRGSSFWGTQKANPHGMVDPKNDSRTILYRVTALRLRKPLELPGTKFSSQNADFHRVSNLPEDRKPRTGVHQHSMGEGIKKNATFTQILTVGDLFLIFSSFFPTRPVAGV